MISFGQKAKLVNSIKSQTVSSVRESQVYSTPFVLDNTTNSSKDHYSTYINQTEYNDTDTTRRRPNVQNVKKFRYNDEWYSYKYQITKPEEAYGILKVDKLPFKSFYSKRNKKSFIGRLDRLVIQGYMYPIMLYVDYKFVKWDDIDVVYDSGDAWLLLHGVKYNYYALEFKDIYLVTLPFACDYIGEESDELFDLNYRALVESLQESSEVIANDLYIKVPTFEGEYEYDNMLFNVGGWLYIQIKKYYLGVLSEDRVNKLRKIAIYKYTKDSLGNVINTYTTRFNALDRDVYTNQALFDSMCYMDYEFFTTLPNFRFDNDGLLSDTGKNILCIRSQDIDVRHMESSETDFIYDNSDIDQILFRENYLVFENGKFAPRYQICAAINNVSLYNNENALNTDVYVIYNKKTSKAFRNSDMFLSEYMAQKATKYLQLLFKDDYEPETGLDAITNDGRIFKNITAYYLDTDVAYVPTLTDYIVYINDANEHLLELMNRAMDPLDFNYDIHKLQEENIQDAIEAIVNYNPLLLNDLYPTYIDSYSFTGSKCNEGLSYDFAYENRRGLKIPRKKWRDNETYCMVFLNGILHENYHQMIAYTNFFFLPVNGTFRDSDIIEVLYFKNVNNNEIRFGISEWLVNQWSKSSEDPNFYECKIFEPYIRPEELNIFSHYPEKMLYYPSLVNEPKDEIAFNISYRDSQGNLCIKSIGITDIDKWPIVDFKDLIALIPKDGVMKSSIQQAIESGNPDYYRIILEENHVLYNIQLEQDVLEFIQNLPYELLEKLVAVVPKSGLIPFSDYQAQMSGSPEYYQRILDENIIIGDIGINNIREFNEYTNEQYDVNSFLYVATSKHKFVYQRLYVDQKCYRIRLDRRFRYCDNLKQYMLFINGRRMNTDTYLITIPKHTRPFTGLYLYTARFVGPEDRVELFYVPDEMTDVNMGNPNRYLINENGYITADRNFIDFPLCKELFLAFVNGKKIPSSKLINIDSFTMKASIDLNTRGYVSLTPIGRETLPEVVNYLHGSSLSKLDQFTNYIKSYATTSIQLGYQEFNKMTGSFVTLSDNEPNMVWGNVAHIAILNEIIRDFWVTTGYPYNEEPVIYDYELDEYFVKDENGNYITPAMDATQLINIGKNYTSFLYFYADPNPLIYEIGDVAKDFTFYWDYSQRINQDLTILHQNLNGVDIDVEERSFIWPYEERSNKKFKLTTNTGNGIIKQETELSFVNGVYWGVIDEDSLQYYRRNINFVDLDNIVALVPKNGVIKSLEEQKIESGSEYFYRQIIEENDIIRGLTYEVDSIVETSSLWDDPSLINVDLIPLMAVTDDGREIHDIFWGVSGYNREDGSVENIHRLYFSEADLNLIIPKLDKHLINQVSYDIKDFRIKNHNYFVYACPKRMILDQNKNITDIEFYFPDPYNEDIVSHCWDDKETPIYTNGEFDPWEKTLVRLDKIEMLYMGECEFTNNFGVTETYMAWMSNGFFTRLFSDYGIDIGIRSDIDTPQEFRDTIITYDPSTDPKANEEIPNVDYEKTTKVTMFSEKYSDAVRLSNIMRSTSITSEDELSMRATRVTLNDIVNASSNNAQQQQSQQTTPIENSNNNTQTTNVSTNGVGPIVSTPEGNIAIMGRSSGRRASTLTDDGLFFI